MKAFQITKVLLLIHSMTVTNNLINVSHNLQSKLKPKEIVHTFLKKEVS
jgi:hypothetical protein